MPKKLGGHTCPRPLRDADTLLGLPDLSGEDLPKVTLANKLYKIAISLLKLCFIIECLVSLENPGRSWSWPLLALLEPQTHDPEFIEWYLKLEGIYFDWRT